MDKTIEIIIALIAIIASSFLSGCMLVASRYYWGDQEKKRKEEAARMKAALEKIAMYKAQTRQPGEEWQTEAYRFSTLAREALGWEVPYGE